METGIRRSAWKAGLMSLLLPGLGQVYNGQARKGGLLYLLFQSIALASVAFIIGPLLSPWTLVGGLVLCLIVYGAISLEAAKTARQMGATVHLKWYHKWYVYLLIILVAHVVVSPILGLPFLNAPIRAFKLSSPSMQPSVLAGDFVLTKVLEQPNTPLKRQDIIVFPYPWIPERRYLKRIVALPGERVELRNQELYVNGQPLQEAYTQYIPGTGASNFGPVAVPKKGDTVEIRNDRRLYLNSEPVSIPEHRFYPRDDREPMSGFDVFYGVLFPAGTTLDQPIGPLTIGEDYYFTLGDNRNYSKDSRYWGFVPRTTVLGVVERIYWSWDQEVKRVRWDRIGKAF